MTGEFFTLRDKVLKAALDMYAAAPEYLWAKFPNYAVLRHKENRKWFALIMDITYEKLGEEALSGKVDVLNVKLSDTLLLDMLLKREGYYKGYHISRGNWLSVTLDGRVSMEDICELLRISFDTTDDRKRK